MLLLCVLLLLIAMIDYRLSLDRTNRSISLDRLIPMQGAFTAHGNSIRAESSVIISLEAGATTHEVSCERSRGYG